MRLRRFKNKEGKRVNIELGEEEMKAEFKASELSKSIEIPVNIKIHGLRLFELRLKILPFILFPIFKLLEKLFLIRFDLNYLTERSSR